MLCADLIGTTNITKYNSKRADIIVSCNLVKCNKYKPGTLAVQKKGEITSGRESQQERFHERSDI